MISTRLHGLAAALRANPTLADVIANRIETLADDAAILEAVAIPANLRAPVALPDGVTRLADWRQRA